MTQKRPWLFVGDIPGVPPIRRVSSAAEAAREAVILMDYFLQRNECRVCRETLAQPQTQTWAVDLLMQVDFPYQLLDALYDSHEREHRKSWLSRILRRVVRS